MFIISVFSYALNEIHVLNHRVSWYASTPSQKYRSALAFSIPSKWSVILDMSILILLILFLIVSLLGLILIIYHHTHYHTVSYPTPSYNHIPLVVSLLIPIVYILIVVVCLLLFVIISLLVVMLVGI